MGIFAIINPQSASPQQAKRPHSKLISGIKGGQMRAELARSQSANWMLWFAGSTMDSKKVNERCCCNQKQGISTGAGNVLWPAL